MSNREMINEEDLEMVSGGSITNTYSKATKTGTVKSRITGEVYHYTSAHKADIYYYLSAHRGDSDADNMAYLRAQGWVS